MAAAIYILGVIGALAVFLATYLVAGASFWLSLFLAVAAAMVAVTVLVVLALVVAWRKDRDEAAESKIPTFH